MFEKVVLRPGIFAGNIILCISDHPGTGGRGRGVPPPGGWSGTIPHMHVSPMEKSPRRDCRQPHCSLMHKPPRIGAAKQHSPQSQQIQLSKTTVKKGLQKSSKLFTIKAVGNECD